MSEQMARAHRSRPRHTVRRVHAGHAARILPPRTWSLSDRNIWGGMMHHQNLRRTHLLLVLQSSV